MKELRDRVAVVTGAASGIGFALAERFATEGMKLVLADVEEGALAGAAQQLEERGAKLVAVRTDVSQKEQVEALAERSFAAFGAVHVVCNNAGVSGRGMIWEGDGGDWTWVLGVNLWGVIHGVRAFVPRMMAQGGEGHIVNTASMAGMITAPGMGSYNVSKFGVVALSETLHHELAMVGSSLKVSVVCPGWVNTRIADADRNRPGSLAARPTDPQSEAMQQFVRDLLAGGLSPARVAEMVVEAIREQNLYVLTHPSFMPLFRERAEAILAGRNPSMGNLPN